VLKKIEMLQISNRDDDKEKKTIDCSFNKRIVYCMKTNDILFTND